MKIEELKTCLGQMLADLRGNWGWDYIERIDLAIGLCNQLGEEADEVKWDLEAEKNNEDGWDGRVFRGVRFYGYYSPEGLTDEVVEWLECNLTYPESSEALNSRAK